MAELVDAADSKSVVRTDVGVRVSLGAPSLMAVYGVYDGQIQSFIEHFPGEE